MKIPTVTWDSTFTAVDAHETVPATDLPMDHDEFAGFHQRTVRQLWAYLARVSGDAALADDLLQESYLRFLGARVPDGEVARRSYLFRIASNLLRDHWRRRPQAQLDELPEQTATLPAIDDRMDAQTTLGPAFKRMKLRERQLLWLAYAEGATHKEISEVTGLAETSIRILLFRAKRKLARLLRTSSGRMVKL
jgi:RNA polymerase sigma-70 factor (ECF subfamily)